jgi:hypothetical protein
MAITDELLIDAKIGSTPPPLSPLTNKGIMACSVPSLFILFLWQVEALPSFPLQWPKNVFFNYSFP